jgi:hypothetical protein
MLRIYEGFVASFDMRTRNPKWVLEYINSETLKGEGTRCGVFVVVGTLGDISLGGGGGHQLGGGGANQLGGAAACRREGHQFFLGGVSSACEHHSATVVEHPCPHFVAILWC